MAISATVNLRSQDLNHQSNASNHLAHHTSVILLTGALLLVGASAALGSYFGYVIGSQQHTLLGLVFAGCRARRRNREALRGERDRQLVLAVERCPSACLPHARRRVRHLLVLRGAEPCGNHARRHRGDSRGRSRCCPRRAS